MKYLIIPLLFMTITTFASEPLPTWLNKKISTKPNPSGIEKYEFNQKTVYLVMVTCCDHGFRELYNEKGDLICKLKESVAGLDDSNCLGFNANGKWISTVFSHNKK